MATLNPMRADVEDAGVQQSTLTVSVTKTEAKKRSGAAPATKQDDRRGRSKVSCSP